VRLHGWWIPCLGSRIATLFLHGNAGNITHRIEHARQIAAAGSSLLLVDYRGYGKSEGRPSEKGLYRMRQSNYRVDRGGSWDYRLKAAQAEGVSSASR
jgi:pimeloyl-ACP methyl ester carboxylesterase